MFLNSKAFFDIQQNTRSTQDKMKTFEEHGLHLDEDELRGEETDEHREEETDEHREEETDEHREEEIDEHREEETDEHREEETDEHREEETDEHREENEDINEKENNEPLDDNNDCDPAETLRCFAQDKTDSSQNPLAPLKEEELPTEPKSPTEEVSPRELETIHKTGSHYIITLSKTTRQKEKPPTSKDAKESHMVTLACPNENYGLIIGKKGETIKYYEQQHLVRI
ncbi:aspartic and glutamic acid-rich protein-like [Procambarus clarkii]|uniref:aspartic and glutamic acid-rich protein-like n=1 Tax=Procambarus clarkii TaxID=6728 RepID=UPI003742991D